MVKAAPVHPSSSGTSGQCLPFPMLFPQNRRSTPRHPTLFPATQQLAPGTASPGSASALDTLSASWVALRSFVNLKRQLAELDSVLVQMNAIQIFCRSKHQSSLADSLWQTFCC